MAHGTGATSWAELEPVTGDTHNGDGNGAGDEREGAGGTVPIAQEAEWIQGDVAYGSASECGHWMDRLLSVR